MAREGQAGCKLLCACLTLRDLHDLVLGNVL